MPDCATELPKYKNPADFFSGVFRTILGDFNFDTALFTLVIISIIARVEGTLKAPNRILRKKKTPVPSAMGAFSVLAGEGKG